MNSEKSTPNWPLLAGARFCLALIVLCAHLIIFAPDHPLSIAANYLNRYAAVAAFLLISGYSIADSYASRPHGFYARRFNRIYPVYFVCALLAMVPFVIGGVGLIIPTTGINIEAPEMWVFILNALCLQGIFAPVMSTLAPGWSLGLEVLLYALTPLIARCNSKVLQYLVAASLFCFAVQPFIPLPWLQKTFWGQSGIGPLACLSWLWFAGWMLRLYPDTAKKWIFLMAGAFAVNTQNIPVQAGVLLIGLTALALLEGHRVAIPRKWVKPLNWLGDLSYPLYLVHYPIYWLLVALKVPFSATAYVGAAMLGGIAVLLLVDYPYRAYVRWKQPARAHKPPAPELYQEGISTAEIQLESVAK